MNNDNDTTNDDVNENRDDVNRNNTIIGTGNTVGDDVDNSVIIGTGNTVGGGNSVVVGTGNTVGGGNSVVLGINNTVVGSPSLNVNPDVNMGVTPDVNMGVNPDANMGVNPDANMGVNPDANHDVAASDANTSAGQQLQQGGDPFADMMEQMQAFNSIYDNAVDKISTSFDTLREEVEEKNRQIASVHNLLETVIDNTTNAIYVIDSDGEELLSNNRSKLLMADLGSEAFQRLIREARHDDINVVEDGFRYFKVSYHDLDSSEYQGKVYVIDEITRLRNLEKESQRDQNLRMMGEMAANIAHDIRNPLGSIELFASLLGRDLSTNHESQKLVKKIGTAVRTVDSIISNMLIFTRDMNISPKEYNVRSLVDDVVIYLIHMIRDKGIDFQNTIDEDVMIVCDGELMKRVFMNIINNSVDAIHEGGKISLSSTCENNTLFMKFYDSGSGIPEDMLERLFMPFQTTKAKGTGLGLSIVYKLVQAHGFRIKVDTDSKTFTEFTIEIPLKIG